VFVQLQMAFELDLTKEKFVYPTVVLVGHVDPVGPHLYELSNYLTLWHRVS
jgi:hypothetical protein